MNKLIKNIKKLILPVVIHLSRARRALIQEWLVVWAHLHDMIRYQRYSFRYGNIDGNYDNISAAIIMDAHAVEKGMSLPDIRPGYGEQRIRRILDMLRRYREKNYPADGLAVRKAQAVFSEYLNYHESIGFDLGKLGKDMKPAVQQDCSADGGYYHKSREELLRDAHGDFAACALSRYSVRIYENRPVDVALLEEAVAIARKTPSVCNRQSWHLYAVKTPELKKKVLQLQSGNRGFGDTADCLLIVTSDIRSFWAATERNEAYIDGGLFSMSLMYALHYKGLGVCPLNWMVLPGKDAQMRSLLDMKPSENIIMILSVGHLPESVRVAKSVRHDVSSILTVK